MKEAIRFAAANVRIYHERQVPAAMSLDAVQPGVYAGERASPIASVGLYAPRGKGSFPSSTYMMVIPASVAGVGRVVVVTPPDAAGDVIRRPCTPRGCAARTRSTAWVESRRSPRWHTARRASVPLRSSWGPATSTSPRPSVSCHPWWKWGFRPGRRSP